MLLHGFAPFRQTVLVSVIVWQREGDCQQFLPPRRQRVKSVSDSVNTAADISPRRTVMV